MEKARLVMNWDKDFLLPEQVPIIGTYHVAMMNDWVPLVQEQEARLVKSGLLGVTSKVFVGMVGDADVKKWQMTTELSSKALIVRDPEIKHCENPTLNALYQEARSSPYFKAWYIHTKGISSSLRTVGTKEMPAGDPEAIRDWRLVMEYFVIDRFKDCISILNQCDVCGVKLQREHRYFSGNFWWANSTHLKRLPPVLGKDRLFAEKWVGMAPGILRNLYNCEVSYTKRLPEEEYRPSSKEFGHG